ncbi:histidine phosphatase family protein [Aestuariimicrobium ganziense]|uniref:histidine phosphatase family protein n=1 Tax=Aestuariimicrobium ganziense TaxID=2773677 RepID=UPI001940FE8F|nr:histidine phosphatase family protein [Aestuariimicrobium ganziense]
MKLLIVRHGQSTNNAAWEQIGTYARTTDPGLTELGHAQAQALADWMVEQGPRPSRIFCSLMRRTILTAHPWAEGLDLPVEARVELHENGGCYSGEYHDQTPHPGSPRGELQALSTRVVLPEQATEAGWWTGPTEAAADSLRRAARVADWLWTLEDDCVALVIHGAIGSMLLSALLQPASVEAALALDNPGADDLSVWYRLDNTSVTLLELEHGRRRVWVDWVNRVDHLTTVDHLPSRTHHPVPPAIPATSPPPDTPPTTQEAPDDTH